MKVICNLNYKNISETAPGDLILMPTRDGDLAIILDKLPNASTSVAVLSQDHSRSFVRTTLQAQDCLSYGGDWSFKPKFSNVSGRPTQKYIESPGVFHFTREGFFLTVKPDVNDFMSSISYFNISTNLLSELPYSRCVPVMEWSIYTNDDENPIFQFFCPE